MRKYPFLGLFFVILAGLALAQQLAVESNVINVEVPVRVYRASRFIDNLTINDFDIYEDGKLQKLEAVYLVKKRDIERRDELTRFVPQTERSFFLFFEISDYTEKLGEALDFFIQNVIMPGDNLTITTPMKTYRLKPKVFEGYIRKDIVEQLKRIIRLDSQTGSSEYRSAIVDLENLAKAMVGTISDYQNSVSEKLVDTTGSLQYKDMPIDDLLNRYSEILANVESMRTMDQSQLLNFSKILKSAPGQKYVYLFYQRELLPKIDPRILYTYTERYQDRPDIYQTIQGIFEFYRRDVLIDVNAVKEAYADSSVAIHFLLITTPAKQLPGVKYFEQSEDVFSAFLEMARATGGFVETSANASFLMKSAVESSENYYLLYYTPRPYNKDGKFHKIVVNVKDKDCRVSHRLGYYGN
jgi:VWFA-related protein